MNAYDEDGIDGPWEKAMDAKMPRASAPRISMEARLRGHRERIERSRIFKIRGDDEVEECLRLLERTGVPLADCPWCSL